MVVDDDPCVCVIDKMAMDVVQAGLSRPSVNRCLFGRPTAQEQASFTARENQKQNEDVRRFCRRWNLDLSSEGEVREGGPYRWVKSASDSDLPEFYSRGYSSKQARRRALTPSPGKSLNLGEEGGEERAGSPVQYMESSSVEVYLGMIPRRTVASADCLVPIDPPGPPSPPPEPMSFSTSGLPPPSSRLGSGPVCHEQWGQPSSSSCSSTSSPSSPPSSSSGLLPRQQGRVTNWYPARKRSRSLTPNREPVKREHRDSS